jgi:phosphopantothenoylcysteine decarboxylase / phosphopantothenate---cysteine ligase
VSAARRRVVLGVAGGIAAYKSATLLRLLAGAGHEVRVVPTSAALEFVGAATWAALSGLPVSASVWDDVQDVPHVLIGQQADLVVVAPATADLLAKAAHGMADDLLTNVLLTARCPVLFAPAMHTEMWQHPATQDNVAALRARGAVVLDPAWGRLTGADSGPGRLPEPEAIAEAALTLLRRAGRGPDLAGLHVAVSAGGTREPLDPVRYLGNRSSGRQGVALAATAAARGARVTLVAANVDLPRPAGVEVVPVGSAEELREAMHAVAPRADVLVMAAAVADFRPDRAAEHKIKKSGDADDAPLLRLVRTPDVLVELVAARAQRRMDDGRHANQVIVGFAAETGDASGSVLDHARRKLAQKGCDLIVVNDVSSGKVFGRELSEVTLLEPGGEVTEVPPGGKPEIADAVWDAVLRLRARTQTGSAPRP